MFLKKLIENPRRLTFLTSSCLISLNLPCTSIVPSCLPINAASRFEQYFLLSLDSFRLTLMYPGLPLLCVSSISSYQAFITPTFVSQYFQLSLSNLYPWTPELFPVSSYNVNSYSSHCLSSYLFIFHCSTFSDRSFSSTFSTLQISINSVQSLYWSAKYPL